jgi:hypothetical protein
MDKKCSIFSSFKSTIDIIVLNKELYLSRACFNNEDTNLKWINFQLYSHFKNKIKLLCYKNLYLFIGSDQRIILKICLETIAI